jgi:hypothetical protein
MLRVICHQNTKTPNITKMDFGKISTFAKEHDPKDDKNAVIFYGCLYRCPDPDAVHGSS